ncbi:MAG: hypothetical protein ACRDJM_03360 [Actinomycetota bacterium]
MRKSITALVATVIAALLVPVAGGASGACAVVWDPSGDVAGPLGTPRPAKLSGAGVDITGVSMASVRDRLIVTMTVRDLGARQTAGTDGAFYAVFWSLGFNRYFAQATRVGAAAGWTFQAGNAAGIDDRVPQEGFPVDGSAALGQDQIRMFVPLSVAGGPAMGELLQQVRARTEESSLRQPTEADLGRLEFDNVATLNDSAGGLEGGRYLFGGACLGLLSAAGERCVVATDPAADAIGGQVGDVTRGTEAAPLTRSLAYGPVDPATEILAVQMGANSSTLIVELAVASLRRPVPDGADAEEWAVNWIRGPHSFAALAERRATGVSFGYAVGGASAATSGSIDTVAGTIRILVPRHEIDAESLSRFVDVSASARIVTGPVKDLRDTAGTGFATQFVAGASCAEQEKASCPVVLDGTGDAGVADRPIPEEQPASDMTAGGAASPAGELVLSVRVPDIGAPPPDGFDRQGWTISWVWGATRYYAQAERTERDTVFRYGIVGPAAETTGPSGARFLRSLRADGSFDARTGVVSVVVPRSGVGSPWDGAQIRELGAQSWVMSTGTGTSPELKVDETPLAPYRVGIACGA